MQLIVWKERFVLGVQQIDEDHQHLVGLLNRAYDNLITGLPIESVESNHSIVQNLCRLLQRHQ